MRYDIFNVLLLYFVFRIIYSLIHFMFDRFYCLESWVLCSFFLFDMFFLYFVLFCLELWVVFIFLVFHILKICWSVLIIFSIIFDHFLIIDWLVKKLVMLIVHCWLWKIIGPFPWSYLPLYVILIYALHHIFYEIILHSIIYLYYSQILHSRNKFISLFVGIIRLISSDSYYITQLLYQFMSHELLQVLFTLY